MVALTILLLPLTAATQATWADGRPSTGRCMSYGEAKRLHRGAYLRWIAGARGRRCWDVSGRRARTPVRGEGVRALSPEVRAEQPPPEPWNLLDHPSWAWVKLARLRPPPIDEPEPWVDLVPFEAVFSTFAPGEEPEVWPQMETAAPGWGAAVVALLVGMLVGASLMWRPRWLRPLLAAGVRQDGR